MVQPRSEQYAASECFLVLLFGCERFTELAARFAAGAILGACFEAKAAVSGGVDVDLCFDAIQVLALVAARHHAIDRAVLHAYRIQNGFEEQSNIRFADDFVVEKEVPELPATLRIIGGVIEANLLDEPALAPAWSCAV